MSLGSCSPRSRILAWLTVLIVTGGLSFGCQAPALASAAKGSGPNLARASAYLVAPANLIDGHYYESFPHAADFGLTIDVALALAATGQENPALRKIVAFLAAGGKDASGKTINNWTGLGTADASGGAIGKEALLAEVVGDNPRSFGGHNLIAGLDALVCVAGSAGTSGSAGSAGADGRCPSVGSYAYATSVFDQALGIMAQLRAGQREKAAAPIAYLESLQNADGSFASLIPAGGGPDVDSTAMAVMALALAPGPVAAAHVTSGVAWIARQQESGGGFPGAGGDSINSAGLAIQALTLRAAQYQPRISAAQVFLARQQNSDGGFKADAGGQEGSNLRASAQAVGGAVGISFGILRRDLNGPSAGTGPGISIVVVALLAALALAVAAVLALLLLRRGRLNSRSASQESSRLAHRVSS